MRPSLTLWLIAPLLFACSEGGGGGGITPSGAHITVQRGSDQVAEVGALLNPIVIAIIDANGLALPGVLVTIRASAGGTVATDRPRSGSDGTVTIQWRLGATPGAQALEIEAEGASAIQLAAQATMPPADRLPFDVPVLIDLPTYDGSGQVVHPDVAADPPYPRRLLMAFTPYAYGDARLENPSIVTTFAPRAWNVAFGLTNPLVLPSNGHLSDPDLVAPIGDSWSLYYRAVLDGDNRILLMRSADAVRWDRPVEVLRAPSHAVVSPAIVREGSSPSWKMWAVNSGAAGCRAAQTAVELRESADGLRWGAPVATDLTWPGRVAWHLDVIWVAARREYWALVATYPTGGSCVTDELQFARSADGVRWTRHAEPILAAGALPEFSDVIYRSSLQLDRDPDSVVLWLSGARYDGGRYLWRAGALRVTIDRLLSATGLLVPANYAGALADRVILPPPEPDL